MVGRLCHQSHNQAAPRTPEESAARSVATAGSAVIFAGLTVIIALVGLAVAALALALRAPFIVVLVLAGAAGALVHVVAG